ncbi:hypothetical protein [Stakelama marina]|uniref:Uncharacterized protein n=1 Tax=Stakelama marina TaxID=2826939 RepID=A0A8T4ICX5_9SPHN|nr:hypothetical protein [Stakelama marina]MBR0551704.1 hypothetical protein [Stakelama marina]
MNLRLLLLLTALLTGFSGAAAAERTAQPVQIERSNLAAAVYLLSEARTAPAAHRMFVAERHHSLVTLATSPVFVTPDSRPLASLAPVDERRLE